MFFSQKLIRYILGAFWLIDGLLQLQPKMFTASMVHDVLLPTLEGQPGPVSASLHLIITVLGQNLTLVNVLIAIVQVEIGLFLIAGLWLRATVIFSIVWALLVWYGGEGMNMLLTGQASVLTGAPGPVLLYPLVGLLLYPRSPSSKRPASGERRATALISPVQFRYILAGFWIFAALLQLQPYWWQEGRISQMFGDLVGQGGINAFLVDPVLLRLSTSTASLEIPLNLVLIEIFLMLGIALARVKQEHLRAWLLVSILLSLVIWWIAQGFGMIFTGLGTDVNSGLLLVLMALACWPRASRLHILRRQATPESTLSERVASA